MFENILGNEHLKDTLVRLRRNGRLPGAMLFTGPNGVGKRMFALDLARSFVCRPEGVEPGCGTCPPCSRAGKFEFPKPDDRDGFKKVIFSNHPDVGMIVAHGRNILVDAVRDLENEAHFRPYEGEARTFIVDEAEKMNDAASNALLKTLEEPASTSKIILVTSRPESLLSTIRSRCQTFRFAPVLTELIEQFLIEKKATGEAEARVAARLSQGSVGGALAIDVGRVQQRRGELAEALEAAVVRGDVVRSLAAAEQLAEARNKEHFEADLDLLVTMLRDIWTLSLGGPENSLIHSDMGRELARIAEGADAEKLTAAIQQIELMRERFAVNVNRKLAADELFVKMAA